MLPVKLSICLSVILFSVSELKYFIIMCILKPSCFLLWQKLSGQLCSKTDRRQFYMEVVASNFPISFCRSCTVLRFVRILFFCQLQELGLYPLHIALAKQALYVNNSIFRLTKLPLHSEVGSNFDSRIDLFVVWLRLNCTDRAI